MPYNYYNEDEDLTLDFAVPGGHSALHAGKRDQSCPTCGRENMLTKADARLGYQCDFCANACEGDFSHEY